MKNLNNKSDEYLKEIQNYIRASRILQILNAICVLSIPELLKNAPSDLETISRKTKTAAPKLERILRAATALGYLRKNSKGLYARTEKSKILMSPNRTGLKFSILKAAGQPNWTAWANLADSTKLNKSAFRLTTGLDSFSYFSKNKDIGDIFDKALAASSVRADSSLISSFVFEGYKTVTDLGGGTGSFLKLIKEQYRNSTYNLFELDSVLKRNQKKIAGINPISGDLFQANYPKSDLYILKKVMHDWNDMKCLKILLNCKKGLSNNGKILIFEIILSDREDSNLQSILADIEMLVMTEGGRERTYDEFHKIVKKAGLRIEKIKKTSTPLSLLIVSKDVDY